MSRSGASHDLAIVGGRVVDPETGLDAERNVGIVGGRIASVTADAITARHTVEAHGLVVAPGWIDLHSHAQTVAGGRLHARDGVTTALDLEGGLLDVAGHYARAGEEGRPINYGYSTSWQQARMLHVGALPTGELVDILGHFGDPAWKRTASDRQLDRIEEHLRRDLADGAIGIGLLVGYAPGVDPAEYVRMSAVAADTGTATFTHARDLVEHVPHAVIDGAEELVRAAESTGAHSHYCHINSTSLWDIDRVHDLIERSPARVTTEAYPYGAAATSISADFLAPNRLHEHRLTPASIVYSPTGERIADAARLDHLRATDPGAVAIIHYLDEHEPRDQEVLRRALGFPGTVIGSDAMPLSWPAAVADPQAWPPPDLTVHPRGAGTFSRYLRRYVRELGTVSLVDAIHQCTLGPAQILEPFVPAMRTKGRIRTGADADLVVFDPDTVTDHATYDAGTRASTGYAAVVVGGELLVENDVLRLDVLPGRPVRAVAQ
ncbi:amidohydrolase family protein [Nocardioides carbamazepini]|uniref:amidohydrolase family protein n=1 Tax=Nocardioides carbamazepini TaxID=2854259 RepID=UPI00214A7A70|nr:amidohydrolase family protein [Nocardioides carbamazepini]MCR1783813.1 amidohydrolase family protein [Nocardioides carbamazepini]